MAAISSTASQPCRWRVKSVPQSSSGGGNTARGSRRTAARGVAAAEHLYLTGRYAPGYGDCPLELNDELCLAVDTVRGCGLAVTPQHLLTPRKSTTAILGIADHPVTGTRAGCATCHLKETCSFRKRGTTCFTQD